MIGVVWGVARTVAMVWAYRRARRSGAPWPTAAAAAGRVYWAALAVEFLARIAWTSDVGGTVGWLIRDLIGWAFVFIFCAFAAVCWLTARAWFTRGYATNGED